MLMGKFNATNDDYLAKGETLRCNNLDDYIKIKILYL